MYLRLLGRAQLLPEGAVLILAEGAVDIIRRPLVVAGGEPGAGHVDALKSDQGRGGIKEVEGGALAAGEGLQMGGQGVTGQRAGGGNDLALRQLGDLALLHRDVGMGADRLGDKGGKALAVHRQRAARLHPRRVRRLENQAVQLPQLLFEQAHGVLQPGPPQGVGADQLGKEPAGVGGGHLPGLHLPQRNRDAPPGQLPGGLAAGQAGADDSCFHCVPFSSDRPTR